MLQSTFTRNAQTPHALSEAFLRPAPRLAAGQLHVIREPETVTVYPPSRAVPADGASTVRVRVTPRAPDGSPRAVDRVALVVTHGTGRVTQPMTPSGESWEAELTAPTQPGSARLEVRIDDDALPLHPRVFWQAP